MDMSAGANLISEGDEALMATQVGASRQQAHMLL
jgi:hypothetical protein